jgi:hypothetical protein
VVNFGGFLEFLSFFGGFFFQKKRIFDKIFLLKDFFCKIAKDHKILERKLLQPFCFITEYAYQCYFFELYL